MALYSVRTTFPQSGQRAHFPAVRHLRGRRAPLLNQLKPAIGALAPQFGRLCANVQRVQADQVHQHLDPSIEFALELG